MASQADLNIKGIEKDIMTLLESKGYVCPKFFLVKHADCIELRACMYTEDPHEVWSSRFEKEYPDLYDKAYARWVRIGDHDLMILGIDQAVSSAHFRARDRHSNEWLIPIDDLFGAAGVDG